MGIHFEDYSKIPVPELGKFQSSNRGNGDSFPRLTKVAADGGKGFNPLIEAMGIYSCPTRITSDNGGPVSIL